MEHERLPSGIFFATANPQLDVQPYISQYRIDRSSETNLPLRKRLEFRTASSAVDAEDDRRYLPLLEVSVDVKVAATISRTTLKQTYSNHSDITIEGATYCFPLYDGSTVVESRAWIGQERLLEGKIKPKDIARAEFQEAVSRQRTAALLEEVTPEVFETSLGNIPAHTTVKVEIQYINELKADLSGDGVLVTIPTSVAPRYGQPPQDYSQASKSNSIVEPEENGLSIQVEVSTLVPIQKLESRTHPISVELGGESHLAVANSFRDLASASTSSSTAGSNPKIARATLSNQTTSLGKDFVLLILAANAAILASRALIEHIPNRPDHSALMVTINPRELFRSKIVLENTGAEILFLADRSGSMNDKIEALKRAMRVFLKSIPEKCYFNICSFGSSHSLLWPEARRYTQENLEIAETHIRDSFKADMGGTEILSAMKTLVERRTMLDGGTTEVILLTDGEVWNTDATVKFVQQTRERTENNVRFFALGIGNAVSHRLIEGIGRQGGGFAEVVAVDTAGRWESRVIRMLKGALTQPHWNCEILLPGATPESEGDTASIAMPIQRPTILQAPYQIPTLHAFQRTSVYFLVNSQLTTKLTSITVKTVTASGETIQLEIPTEQIDMKPLTIHHLAAKAVMNDLETGQSWMHGDKCQEYQKRHPAAFEQALKSEAEKIGIEWSIVGKWTSFVAVDNSHQIEQKTRIYRAERSELMDLSRRRFSGRAHLSRDLAWVGRDRDRDRARVFGDTARSFPVYKSMQINRGASTLEECARLTQVTVGVTPKGRRAPLPLAAVEPRTSLLAAVGYAAPQTQVRESLNPQGRAPILSPPPVPQRGVNPASPSEWQPRDRKTSVRSITTIEATSIEEDGTSAENLDFLVSGPPIDRLDMDSLPVELDSSRSAPNSPLQAYKIADLQLLHVLIGLQQFFGYFSFSDKMLRSRILGYFAPSVVENIKKQIEEIRPVARWLFQIEYFIDTILIIIFIEAQYPDSSDLYELVVLKARRWILKYVESDQLLDELEKIARDELLKGKGKNKDSKDDKDDKDQEDDEDDAKDHPQGKPNNNK